MDVLKQPHDKLFRSVFARADSAVDFLTNYLPKELLETVDLATLEAQSGSFIDEDLQEGFSDLLFKTRINSEEGYIYLLFEHKSYKDKMVIFQVLKYMISIWESEMQTNKGRRSSGKVELPVILPLVIYHADSEWSIARTLRDMMPSYSGLSDRFKKYIPDFEYLLIDLSDFDEDTIKLKAANMMVLKVLTKTRYATIEEIMDILREVLELIEDAEEKDDIAYYVSVCVKYIFSLREI